MPVMGVIAPLDWGLVCSAYWRKYSNRVSEICKVIVATNSQEYRGNSSRGSNAVVKLSCDGVSGVTVLVKKVKQGDVVCIVCPVDGRYV